MQPPGHDCVTSLPELPSREDLCHRLDLKKPFLVGVVGHRDLLEANKDFLVAELQTYFEKICHYHSGSWPDSVLVTGMARGADQLAVRAVLKDCCVSWSVLPVYPCGPTAYHSAIKKDSTARMSDRSVGLLRCAGRRRPGQLLKTFALNHDEPCVEGYETVAHWMADTCDVLLVLWDGNHNGRAGGTGDTVSYALSETCAAKRRVQKLAPIKIDHLVVPRATNPYPMGERFTWHRYTGLTTIEKRRCWYLELTKGPLRKSVIVFALGALAVLLGCLSRFRPDLITNLSEPGGIKGLFKYVAEGIFSSIGYNTLNDLKLDEISAPHQWRYVMLLLGRFFGVICFLVTASFVVYYLAVDRLLIFMAKTSWLPSLPGSPAPDRKARGHAVVCGVGWQGRRIVEDLVYRDRLKVVVIEKKVDEVFQHWCHSHGVGIVDGDAMDADNLRIAGVEKASAIYAFCRNDETNTRIISTVSSICSPGLRAVVSLRSRRQFETLQASLEHPSRLTAQMINVDALTVQTLLDRYPFDRFPVGGTCDPHRKLSARVLILGNTPMSREILRQVVQTAHFEDSCQVSICMAVPDPEKFITGLVAHYPAYQKKAAGLCTATARDRWAAYGPGGDGILPDIDIVALPAADRDLLDPGSSIQRFIRATPDGESCTFFVAIDQGQRSINSGSSLAAMCYLIDPGRKKDICGFVYVNEKDNAYRQRVMHHMNAGAREVPLVIYGDFLGEAIPTQLEDLPSERKARDINAWYHKRDDFKPFDACGNLVPSAHETAKKLWSTTTEDDKDSSRQAAAHTAVKRRIRQRLLACGVAEPDILRKLSKCEHNRWCAERLLKGVIPLEELTGVKGRSTRHQQVFDKEWSNDKKAYKAALRHIDLMPYDDLLDKEQDKDKFISFSVPSTPIMEARWRRRFLEAATKEVVSCKNHGI